MARPRIVAHVDSWLQLPRSPPCQQLHIYGGAVITYTINKIAGRFQGITRNASHEGQVSYSFPFAVGEFTYASRLSILGVGVWCSCAFSNQRHTDVPHQSLAAFVG